MKVVVKMTVEELLEYIKDDVLRHGDLVKDFELQIENDDTIVIIDEKMIFTYNKLKEGEEK